MKLTKTTVNYAKRRNLDFCVELDLEVVMIFIAGDEEPFLIYNLKETTADNYELTFKCQVYGEKIEDLPYWIKDTKKLNETIDYIAANIKDVV
jgi:hypothetical protein